jgi:hypothetical protein
MKAIVFFLILSVIYFSSLSCNTTDPGRDDNTGGADTTSQNFTFETYEFGDGGSSSYFNDVWVFDENNIWAVGYISPASATVDGVRISNPNIIKWDGTSWKLQPFSGTSSGIYGIWALDTNEIYFANGIIVKYKNNKYNYEDFNNVSLPNGQAVHKIWGNSRENIWGVGPWGTVVHYDGISWRKIDFDTQWHIYNITGDKETGIAYAAARSINIASAIIKLKNNTAAVMYHDSGTAFQGEGITAITYTDNKLWAGGYNILSYDLETNKIVKEDSLYGYYIATAEAASKNDIYFFGGNLGGNEVMIHYNGSRFTEFKLNDEYDTMSGGVSTNGNITVYVGEKNGRGYINMIRRVR